MSVRAYKLLKVATEPSFNLWHDGDLMDFFESTGKFTNNQDNGGGSVSVTVGAIKKALKVKKLWVKEDYRLKQLKKDIRGLHDEDWIDYLCL